ncbi:hypothetical protein [Haloactinospora alba]|nr:hypothetical protein [Haloactinospora alba]
MPSYHAVLAVDTEKYTRTSSHHQQILSSTLRRVLARAFERSGLDHIWREARFPQSTGDGYLVGVPPEHLPSLIHPLLDNLQFELEETQSELASHDRELRLRLRASLELGPLPDSGGTGPVDGIGQAMNDTHRLLDSARLRQALDQSHPDITLLTAMLSRRVYEDAVLGGYVGVNELLFQPVHVHTPEKEYEAEGYLYVPRPSERDSGGGPAPERAPAPQEPSGDAAANTDHPAPAPSAPDSAAANARDGSHQIVQGQTIHGAVRMTNTDNSRTQRGGVGSISGGVGSVVTDPQAPVHTGSGEQHNGPQFGNTGSVNYVGGDNSGTVRGDTTVDSEHDDEADGRQ